MKLLHRTIRDYILYSAILLAIGTPMFYFAIQRLFIHEMDEVLLEHKQDFYASIPHLKTQEDIRFYHLLNKEFILMPVENLPVKDSLYSMDAYDSAEKEIVPYRILRTGVVLQNQLYVLKIQESLVSSRALITAIMIIQAVLLTLLFLGLILINRKLANTIWGPFYSILEKLKQYRIDKDQHLDLPHASTTEFQDLSQVIHELVQTSNEAYKHQKQFTENASHELQTPLAIIRSKLDLLMQSNELSNEQAELIGSLYDTTHRMTRLQRDLLLLSKIENHQFSELENVDIQVLVDKSLELFEQQINQKQLTLKRSIAQNHFVLANPVLTEVLVQNLISNAVRYTPDHGQVEITFTDCNFLVSNTGDPIEHQENLFQRFYRESRSTSGNGLGLAIVKQICEASNFMISYSYTNASHQFNVHLKLNTLPDTEL